MKLQQTAIKIAELEQWLKNNPHSSMRAVIESDLRKLKEEQYERPIERDTFDLREHNFYDL